MVVAPEQGQALPEAPTHPPVTPGEWLKVNLFSSPFNTILTLLVGLLSGWLAFSLLRWVFVTADWTVVRVNTRLFMVGRFPLEEVWRVWAAVYYVAVLSGITWGWSGRRMRWGGLRTGRRAAVSDSTSGLSTRNRSSRIRRRSIRNRTSRIRRQSASSRTSS